MSPRPGPPRRCDTRRSPRRSRRPWRRAAARHTRWFEPEYRRQRRSCSSRSLGRPPSARTSASVRAHAPVGTSQSPMTTPGSSSSSMLPRRASRWSRTSQRPMPASTDTARSRIDSVHAERESAIATASEARLYLRSRGVRATIRKALAAYVIGRLEWWVTVENVTQWHGVPLETAGLEIRLARPDDLPMMRRFEVREPQDVLRRWLGPDFFFFIASDAGEPISYRCLSRRIVHPAVAGHFVLGPHQLFMVDEF